MAFIRKKKVAGKEYAQVVENYREGGKVKQRVLLHLGQYTPAQALSYWTAFGENHANLDWRKWEAKAKTLRELVEQGKVFITEEDQRQLEAERTRAAKALKDLEQKLNAMPRSSLPGCRPTLIGT